MEDLTILLCDDSDDVRERMVFLLNKCNVKKVVQATDGEGVLEMLIENSSDDKLKFDLLITDYIMPKKDGLSLVKEIRGYSSKNKELDSYLKNLPIIVATAEGEINSMLDFVEAGISTYLLKPCDKITLVGKIEEALKTK